MSVIAAIALAGSAAADPLPPTGKWTVHYGNAGCLLSHQFGSGDQAMSVAFQTAGLNDYVNMVVVAARARRGSGTLTIALPDAKIEEKAPFVRKRDGKSGLWVADTGIARTTLRALASAKTMVLRFPSDELVLTPPPGMARALKALDTCEREMLATWGVPPAQMDRPPVPAEPIGSPADWIKVADYPASAVASGQRGTNLILWTIGTDGGVKDCRTLVLTGFAKLDAAGCTAILGRAKFRPARDRNGAPVESWQIRRIIWSLPEPGLLNRFMVLGG